MADDNIVRKRLSGMSGFSLVWAGQIVSVLATNMTGFALTIWVYQLTNSATSLALMEVFFITPFLVFSPLAGVWVDRYNRKLMMMVSDLTAGIGTVIILILYTTGKLQLWQLYAVNILLGLGNTFQWPAYSAAITTMVTKEQYSRANGMMSLIETGPAVFAPLMAGALLPIIRLGGILLIDISTFLLAVSALLVVTIPQPEQTQQGVESKGKIWNEAAYGFTYIFKRPGLLGLQLIFLFSNLFSGMMITLIPPLILSRTANNSLMLGTVQTAGAIGGVAGALLMTIWSGFRRKVNGVLLGWTFASLWGGVLLGLGRQLEVWIAGAFVGALLSMTVNPSNQAIWQAKVAPDVQGRVFSARRLIAWFAQPVAPLIAGLLADYVFEPAFRSSPPTANLLSEALGYGAGTGIGILIFICGLCGALIGLSGYLFPEIREVEDRLPDHDQLERVNGGLHA